MITTVYCRTITRLRLKSHVLSEVTHKSTGNIWLSVLQQKLFVCNMFVYVNVTFTLCTFTVDYRFYSAVINITTTVFSCNLQQPDTECILLIIIIILIMILIIIKKSMLT